MSCDIRTWRRRLAEQLAEASDLEGTPVMAEQGETITIPRPQPDEAVIATCDANGAACWITGKKTTFADDGFLPQILPFLAEGQEKLKQATGA